MTRRPLRLLYVTQAYYPFLDRGGPAVKVRAMARGLAGRGHAVTVLTADLGVEAAIIALSRRAGLAPAKLCRERFGWRLDEDGVEAIYLTVRGSYRALTWNRGVAEFCGERLPDFDVAHIFGFYDLLGPSVARACRRGSLPYVFEPMGMYRPIVRNIPLKKIYRRLLGDATVRGAQRVIATAEQERDELIAEGVPPERVVVRRNGIEPPARLPEPGMFRRERRIPADARVVLFLGRLVSKKSPDLLLEAYARWRETAASEPARRSPARLVLAGPGEGDGYRAQLEALAGKLGIASEVIFTGALYNEKKWAAYRDADVFALPSQNENFGNTAAEAVVCGTPVVVSDQCGIAPLLAGRAGVVVPHDSAALAAALGSVLDSGEELHRLRLGCAAVAPELDWSQPLDETETLYAALSPKPGPGQ